MLALARPAVVMLFLFTALTGVVYPLAILAVGQITLPSRANGSMIVLNDKVIGSRLIGQAFKDAKYFHARPSAAGDGYDAMASSGSNLGPLSQKLIDRIKPEADALRQGAAAIPADAVTASASGLDPDISPANAELQAGRVAAARGISEAQVRAILAKSMEMPILGVFGEPRINVLRLNLALDAELAARSG